MFISSGIISSQCSCPHAGHASCHHMLFAVAVAMCGLIAIAALGFVAAASPGFGPPSALTVPLLTSVMPSINALTNFSRALRSC